MRKKGGHDLEIDFKFGHLWKCGWDMKPQQKPAQLKGLGDWKWQLGLSFWAPVTLNGLLVSINWGGGWGGGWMVFLIGWLCAAERTKLLAWALVGPSSVGFCRSERKFSTMGLVMFFIYHMFTLLYSALLSCQLNPRSGYGLFTGSNY